MTRYNGLLFDDAVHVAWRRVDIGNQGVAAVQRINFAVSSCEDLFVGADAPEGHSPKRR